MTGYHTRFQPSASIKMKIREQIKKQQKPYKISLCISAVLFIGASVGLITFVEFVAKADTTLKVVLLMSICLAYLAGAIGGLAASIFPVLKIRCPACNKRINGLQKVQKYCQFCAVDFDTELKTKEANKTDSQDCVPQPEI